MKRYTIWCQDGDGVDEWVLVADLDREEVLEELGDALLEYPEYEFAIREYQDGDSEESESEEGETGEDELDIGEEGEDGEEEEE